MIEGAAGGGLIWAMGGDSAFGGTGNDNISDSSTANVVEGEKGNDRIASGSPSILRGGPGKDRINAANGGKDEVNCGPGEDTIFFDESEDELKSCEIKKPR